MAANLDPYAGFANYQTWCVNWWLTSDPEASARCRELVTLSTSAIRELLRIVDDEVEDNTRTARDLLATALSELVDEFNPVADQTTLFSDLMGTALGEVDWYGIAERLLSQTDRPPGD